MQINIGINEKHLKKSATLLSNLLATETMLYLKTRKSHWNVSGESFMELHKLFEGQYKELESVIDEIAERIGKLGQPTIGTMHEFAAFSFISEHPGKYPSSIEMIRQLLSDHETITVQVRKNIELCATENKDAGTADFLTGLMEHHETTAWILRRYLN
jgi:starvation-inducible DNA-binding protein